MPTPNIQELDGDSERFIWTTIYNKLGANYTWQGKMLVIDLGSYPYIIAYLDDRDQTPDPGDDSQFAKDVYKLWSEPFDVKKVPAIIVNGNLPFTGVKYILC